MLKVQKNILTLISKVMIVLDLVMSENWSVGEMKTSYRAITDYDIFLPSFGSFVSFMFTIQILKYFLFFTETPQLQNYENTKALNYGQIVHRSITHYALFGCSLVFSCFNSCFLFKDKLFSCFLLKLYNLQKIKHENIKLSQKVQSVYSLIVCIHN
jgi:hypothetical protein